MRLSRCEVRDHINYRKTIAGARIDPTEPCSGCNRSALHLRGFRRPATFEFFNTIGTFRTSQADAATPGNEEERTLGRLI